MTGIDYFAWFIFLTIIVSAAAIFVALAQLPGKNAIAQNHPQADAINVLSWLGLLFTGGIGWIVAFVWSRMNPVAKPIGADSGEEIATLKSRVSELESQLAGMREGQG